MTSGGANTLTAIHFNTDNNLCSPSHARYFIAVECSKPAVADAVETVKKVVVAYAAPTALAPMSRSSRQTPVDVVDDKSSGAGQRICFWR